MPTPVSSFAQAAADPRTSTAKFCPHVRPARWASENGVMKEVATAALSIDDVRAAAERLRGEIVDSPCLASRTLSQICGCAVFLKFENLQFTASFKERGALNKMAQLTPAERAALLERGGELQVLKLEEDGTAAYLRQCS